jgi:hypothetical protein
MGEAEDAVVSRGEAFATAGVEKLRGGQTCLERIDQAERVVPKMQATIEFVSGYVRQQVDQPPLWKGSIFGVNGL